MKKLTAAILIFFYIVNSFGYLIFFFQLRSEIKKEMFNKIEKFETLDLEKIEIMNYDLTNKNFNRIDEREFEYLGKKYDIVKEIKDKDQTIFYCVNDKNEELIEAAFAVYLQDNLGNEEKKSHSKNNLKNKVKENLAKKFQIIKPSIKGEKIISSFYCYFNFYSEITTPPPKLIFS